MLYLRCKCGHEIEYCNQDDYILKCPACNEVGHWELVRVKDENDIILNNRGRNILEIANDDIQEAADEE